MSGGMPPLADGDPLAGSPRQPAPARLVESAETSLLVKFKAGTPAWVETRLIQRLNVVEQEVLPGGTRVWDLGANRTARSWVPSLREHTFVASVEVNRTIHTAAEVIPNDPLFRSQWGLNTTSNIDVDAPEAWKYATPNPIIVALIDTGIDLYHPDLASQLWVNPGEIPDDGVDNDANGYVDDTWGWNYVEDTNIPMDDAGHGTHVAGIVGAAAGNALGIAGLNPFARLMPLKFLGADGTGSLDDAVKAIYYAVQNGARVINASWSGSLQSPALAEALRYADSRGVVFVAAAGNERTNVDRYPSYPGGYASPNVIAVAPADAKGNLAGFSNFGKKTVDLAAPAVNVISTWLGGGFQLSSGTSMATPFVSGAASLLIAQNPGLSANQVVRRILSTTKPMASLKPRLVSGGLIDVDNALRGQAQPNFRAKATPRPGSGGR